VDILTAMNGKTIEVIDTDARAARARRRAGTPGREGATHLLDFATRPAR